MNTYNSILAQLMTHKKWVDMSLYEILYTSVYQDRPDLVKKTLYWLNHIHIVDQIFKSHMLGEPSYFSSTESNSFAPLPELHKAVETLDQWLIDYAQTLNEEAANEVVNFIFTDGDNGSMSRMQMLMHLSSHGLYHIGVTTQELANQDLPVPPLLFTTYLTTMKQQKTPTNMETML